MTLLDAGASSSFEAGRLAPSSPPDRPRRRAVDREQLTELGAAAMVAAVTVWTAFHAAGWDAPFGAVLCWFIGFVATTWLIVSQRHGHLEAKDRVATVVICAGTVVALTPLVFVIYFVIRRGAPVVLTRFPAFPFVRQDLRRFGVHDPVAKAGMKQAIVGSLEQVGLATAITVPVGILAATYLNEIGGRFASIVRTVADAMTGLPTIIAGLFIYSAWVQPRGTKGYSGFAAALALSVVMLPTVVRTAEEVLRIVSDSLREAALALGAPEWRVVLRVVLPTARTGLVTAGILGVARAVGETAPVLLTAFGNQSLNTNVLNGPQDDLPLRIYLLVRSPSNSNVAVAWGGALLLMLVILTLFTLARILSSGAGATGRTARTRWRKLRAARRTS